MTIEKTLEERGKTYGKFEDHATISQMLKDTVRKAPKWDYLDSDMKESLDMIVHKIARILNGDPCYPDSWHDIAGYATLVEKRLVDLQHDLALMEPVVVKIPECIQVKTELLTPKDPTGYPVKENPDMSNSCFAQPCRKPLSIKATAQGWKWFYPQKENLSPVSGDTLVQIIVGDGYSFFRYASQVNWSITEDAFDRQYNTVYLYRIAKNSKDYKPEPKVKNPYMIKPT